MAYKIKVALFYCDGRTCPRGRRFLDMLYDDLHAIRMPRPPLDSIEGIEPHGVSFEWSYLGRDMEEQPLRQTVLRACEGIERWEQLGIVKVEHCDTSVSDDWAIYQVHPSLPPYLREQHDPVERPAKRPRLMAPTPSAPVTLNHLPSTQRPRESLVVQHPPNPRKSPQASLGNEVAGPSQRQPVRPPLEARISATLVQSTSTSSTSRTTPNISSVQKIETRYNTIIQTGTPPAVLSSVSGSVTHSLPSQSILPLEARFTDAIVEALSPLKSPPTAFELPRPSFGERIGPPAASSVSASSSRDATPAISEPAASRGPTLEERMAVPPASIVPSNLLSVTQQSKSPLLSRIAPPSSTSPHKPEASESALSLRARMAPSPTLTPAPHVSLLADTVPIPTSVHTNQPSSSASSPFTKLVPANSTSPIQVPAARTPSVSAISSNSAIQNRPAPAVTVGAAPADMSVADRVSVARPRSGAHAALSLSSSTNAPKSAVENLSAPAPAGGVTPTSSQTLNEPSATQLYPAASVSLQAGSGGPGGAIVPVSATPSRPTIAPLIPPTTLATVAATPPSSSTLRATPINTASAPAMSTLKTAPKVPSHVAAEEVAPQGVTTLTITSGSLEPPMAQSNQPALTPAASASSTSRLVSTPLGSNLSIPLATPSQLDKLPTTLASSPIVEPHLPTEPSPVATATSSPVPTPQFISAPPNYNSALPTPRSTPQRSSRTATISQNIHTQLPPASTIIAGSSSAPGMSSTTPYSAARVVSSGQLSVVPATDSTSSHIPVPKLATPLSSVGQPTSAASSANSTSRPALPEATPSSSHTVASQAHLTAPSLTSESGATFSAHRSTPTVTSVVLGAAEQPVTQSHITSSSIPSSQPSPASTNRISSSTTVSTAGADSNCTTGPPVVPASTVVSFLDKLEAILGIASTPSQDPIDDPTTDTQTVLALSTKFNTLCVQLQQLQTQKEGLEAQMKARDASMAQQADLLKSEQARAAGLLIEIERLQPVVATLASVTAERDALSVSNQDMAARMQSLQRWAAEAIQAREEYVERQKSSDAALATLAADLDRVSKERDRASAESTLLAHTKGLLESEAVSLQEELKAIRDKQEVERAEFLVVQRERDAAKEDMRGVRKEQAVMAELLISLRNGRSHLEKVADTIVADRTALQLALQSSQDDINQMQQREVAMNQRLVDLEGRLIGEVQRRETAEHSVQTQHRVLEEERQRMISVSIELEDVRREYDVLQTTFVRLKEERETPFLLPSLMNIVRELDQRQRARLFKDK